MRRRYTAEQRQQLVSEVQSTGGGVTAAAKRLGVTPSSAYLWIKEAGVEPRPLAFARVVKSSPRAAVASPFVMVEVGGATIRVEPGFDVDLLRSVVAALGGGT
jgi:transposase-like protein